MKKTQYLYISMFIILLIAPITLACKQSYEPQEDVVIIDSIQDGGLNADCNITIYNETTKVQSGWMGQNLLQYSYNASILPKGIYTGAIQCNKSINSFIGECKFKVQGEDNMLLGILVLIPILFGFMMLIGAVSLGDSHPALKIILFLISPITIWGGLHFGAVAVASAYNMPELLELIGTTTYWVGMIFFILLTYFCIYLVMQLVHYSAQKKEERLKY